MPQKMLISKDQIRHFLSGHCLADEAEEVRNYLKNNPNALENYVSDEAVDTFDNTDTAISAAQSEKILKQITESIHRKIRLKNTALLSVMVVLVFSTIYLFLRLEKTNFLEKDNLAQNKVLEKQWLKKTNTKEKASIVQLPDQSTITLYKNSTIEYPEGLQDSIRLVKLSGEAEFQVSKDPKRPFTVVTSNVSVLALGTVFKVKEENLNTIVQLKEGKVKVWNGQHGPNRHYIMQPGDQLLYNNANETFVTSKFNVVPPENRAKANKRFAKDVYAGTKLKFNNISLKTVLDRLSGQFDVSIEYVGDDVQKINIIADIDENTSVEALLRKIAILNDLKIIKKSDTYFQLSKK